MAEERLHGVRRHRRSISQLIASMDDFLTNESTHPKSAPTHCDSASASKDGGITNEAFDLEGEYRNCVHLYGQFDEAFLSGGVSPPFHTNQEYHRNHESACNMNDADSDSIGAAGSIVERVGHDRLQHNHEDRTCDDGEEHRPRETDNDDNDNAETATGCLPDFQFSIIDSEYDETLAFPDSVTILSNVGDKPVLVRRRTMEDEDYDNEDDDDDDDEDDDEDDDVAENCGNEIIIKKGNVNEEAVNLDNESYRCDAADVDGIDRYGDLGLGAGGGAAIGLPLNTLYGPSMKFNSFQRKVFVPALEIQVRIIDVERSVTTHLLNPNLYTIELSHGPYTWTIKRRYKHFNSLHQQLSFFRTSLNIPFPMRSHKEKRATVKTAAIQLANEAQRKQQQQKQQTNSAMGMQSVANDGSVLDNAIGAPIGANNMGKTAEQQNQNTSLSGTSSGDGSATTELNNREKSATAKKNSTKKKKKKKKRNLPRFPNRPESLVTVESLPQRIKQLEDYLYNLLNISLYRNHHETLNFIEASHVSFVAGLGMKGKEGGILKRTGSTRPGQAGCNFFGCFQQKCCVRCNYFCSDVVCGKWRNRWFFVKETCFGYIRPTDGVVRSVILFDQGFDVSTGIYQTGMRKGLQVLTNNRHIVLKCWTRRKSKEWMQYLKEMSNTHARDFTYPNPHMSFAPVRSGIQANWYVDGATYMDAVADGLEAATEEVYIADWWLSPEIYMKRPAVDGDYWRLDKILLRKASQGVRIYVLLYKEVEMAIGINSYYSKQRLVSLHENIKVIRHPDHARAGVFFWAHHEKLVIIDQAYAFLGGIDLCYGRWDDHQHRLTDLGSILTSAGSMTASVSDSSLKRRPRNGSNLLPSSVKQEDDVDSAFGSRKSSRNVTVSSKRIDEFASPSAGSVINSSVLPMDLSAAENVRFSETRIVMSELHAATMDESTLPPEGMKLNTPELERKNMLEKLKDNAVKKGKDLVHRLAMMDIDAEKPTNSSKEPKQLAYAVEEAQDGGGGGGGRPTATATVDCVDGAQVPDAKHSMPLQATMASIPLDFYGQAKYWFGKDYSNFIMKDWMNLDAPLVDMIDRTTTPRMPWHDVGLCVMGAAARDAARHFIQRWNAVKLEKMRDNTAFPYLLPKSYQSLNLSRTVPTIHKRQQRVTCQLLRSAASWSCGFIEHDLVEQSIHDAYIQTITKAQHYIYIENQFFITLQLGVAGGLVAGGGASGAAGGANFAGSVRNQIGETLFKRIVRAHKERKPFRVYVVVPLLPGFEGDVGGSTGNAVRAITHWNYASISRGRSAILTRLREAGISRPSEYISFHSLRTNSQLNGTPITELIYVHSKLLIADDRVCICGSANINDRSMIGKRDSEIAAIITDEEFEDGRMNGKKYPSGIFVGGLRKFLFREHLGLLEPIKGSRNFDITDPINDQFWNGTWRRISARNTKIYDEVFKCIPTNAVKSFATLRKYQEEAPMCKSDPELAFQHIANIQGYLVDLPLEFLNMEVLTPPGASKEGLIPTSVWT